MTFWQVRDGMDLTGARNLLIQRMSAEDRGRLASHFSEMRIDFKQTLLEQDKPINDVYFVEAGVMSMVTDLADGSTIETGTVGNEGLVGLPAVLGVFRAPGRVFCQIRPGASRARCNDRSRSRGRLAVVQAAASVREFRDRDVGAARGV